MIQLRLNFDRLFFFYLQSNKLKLTSGVLTFSLFSTRGASQHWPLTYVFLSGQKTDLRFSVRKKNITSYHLEHTRKYVSIQKRSDKRI